MERKIIGKTTMLAMWLLVPTLAISCGEREEKEKGCEKVQVENDINIDQHLDCWPSPKPKCPEVEPEPPKPPKPPKPPVCNMYLANSTLGDTVDRSVIFSAIVGTSYCEVKNVFHAGDLGDDHESMWGSLGPNLNQVSFYPARGDDDYPWRKTSEFLKSKMPYLSDKLSACKNYYTVETDSSWATVVLDTNDECSWDSQIEFLKSAAAHGYERLEVVMHHSPYSSIGNADTQDWIDIQDILTSSYQPAPSNVVVFSGVAPGYSRDRVGTVDYVTAGSAGPDRGTCTNNPTTERCYPDSSFVICTKSECKAFNRFGAELDRF